MNEKCQYVRDYCLHNDIHRQNSVRGLASHNTAIYRSQWVPLRKLLLVGSHGELRQGTSVRESIGQGLGGLPMDTRGVRQKTQPEVRGCVVSGCENVTW